MYNEIRVSLFDLVESLAEAVDLISPGLANHHKRVAYISSQIGRAMGLETGRQNKLILAGLLHDSGALSLQERLDSLQFELNNPFQHAELTYRLFHKFKPLSGVADIIRYHHLPWEETEKGFVKKIIPEQVLLESAIVHLSDRAAVLFDPQKNPLEQAPGICKRIAEFSGQLFAPQLLPIFNRLAETEYFWLDLAFIRDNSALLERANYLNTELDFQELIEMSKLFGQIVDFRNRFTSSHSSGVAACTEALAKLANFSEAECAMIKTAGYLHDLGKIVVPDLILNKPQPLTEAERNIIKSHPFFTYRLLGRIKNLETVVSWAALHHEKMNGAGYPFHLNFQRLSLGSRIVCIADIFTALTEDRPYRKGKTTDEALNVLQKMADNRELDPRLLALLREHDREIDNIRITAQNQAVEEYEKFCCAPLASFIKDFASLSQKYFEMGI